MIFSKIKKYFWIAALLLPVQALIASESPLPMVIKINKNVIGALKSHQSNLKDNPQFVQNTIRQYFLPYVDTNGMSRSVLGRNAWRVASVDEKKAFTIEFTQLVLRTYAAPLAHYNGEQVEFQPFKTSSLQRFSQVQSVVVRPNGQRIPITYHLVLDNHDTWKIYDLSVEGVSLLNSFRNQFGEALRQDNLKTVIQMLHQKNAKTI
jgi:phospholipid transport system substrate-binding protein